MLRKIMFTSFAVMSLLLFTMLPVHAATPYAPLFDIRYSDEQFPAEELDFAEVPVLEEETERYPSAETLPDLKGAVQWPWNETVKDEMKNWTITLSQTAADSESNKAKVKMFADNGKPFSIKVKIEEKKISITPEKPYESGRSYTLYIEQSLENTNGTTLKKPVFLQFSYKSEEVQNPAEPEDIYSAMYEALLNMEDSVNLKKFTTNTAEMSKALNKTLEMHPDIFYFQYNGSKVSTSGEFTIKYLYPKETIMKMKADLQREIDQLYAAVAPEMTDYEKVKAIHDYIILHTAYDYDNYLKDTVPEESYTMYGLFVNGTAVCEGYALSMVYLLNKIGIETIYVPSDEAMNHAWNKVKIDGKWYNLDATWDDPVPDRKGKVQYNYFLVSDEQLAKTHSWNNAGLPKASDKKYEFMENVWAFDIEDGWIYYANNADDINLYKMRLDGSDSQKIDDIRVYELIVHEGWIYFVNYSHGGYLFKMKTDGSSLTQLTEYRTADLSKEGNLLKFKSFESGKYYQTEMK